MGTLHGEGGVSLSQMHYQRASAAKTQAEGPLLLSPLIKAGKIDEALKRSRVWLFEEACGVGGAYSGYITINETCGTSLFFLHVKAQENSANLPLVLWLEGGPGQSSLLGELFSSGPVGISRNGSLYKREHNIASFSNVIYLDEPVGAGFSFTQNENGYAKSFEDIADNIHDFLRQFLLLFPEYRGRQFYPAGDSYGARPAVATGIKFHKDRNLPGAVQLNFCGVICGVPFIAPLENLLDSTEFLYHIGLLDQKGRELFGDVFTRLRAAFDNRDPIAVADIIQKDLWVSPNLSSQTLFTRLTGYQYDGNALQPVMPPEKTHYDTLMKNREFKEAIHVGANAEFRKHDTTILANLAFDFFRDISPEIIKLLDNYKVLVYVGGLDIVIPAANAETFLWLSLHLLTFDENLPRARVF
ncbi:venom serine carboxypeptidase-like [Ornithodoros turicata]|uniref:venom serine carboxypeptidase-like n=1 Tax=Ornithodoros turicata TaxID=34597 RepID=UPI003139DD30